MYFLALPTLFAAFAFASPVAVPIAEDTSLQSFSQSPTLQPSLSPRDYDLNPTRNELSECKPVTVIFARGTIELGNVGSITGPPFFYELDNALGEENVAVQGVDYPATIGNYLLGGSKDGAQELKELTEQAASECPDTQIVWSGYSQGAQVVHLGAELVSADVASRVAAVVFFGDPKNGQPVSNVDASKVKTFCFVADLICKMLPVVDSYHFSYSVNAKGAAEFVKSKVVLPS